jgi:hypothetical protein
MTDHTNANRKNKINFCITLKNITISILTFLLSTISYGQIVQIKEKPKLIEHNIYPPKITPDVYISIDSITIKLDSVSLKLINPDWIRKAEVIKSEKEKKTFGNTKPTVMLYPKRKYKQELLSNLNKR